MDLVPSKDIPQDIKDDYTAKTLLRKVLGARRNPDLMYGGQPFFLDNKARGNWSPKNRWQKHGTDARRRASTNQQTITVDDYLDFAKKNGYSKSKAVQLFERNQAALRQLQATKGNKAYEHLTPTTSQTYGGVEHWRNLGHLDKSRNSKKGSKLMSSKDARNLKIPLSKQSALQMDFNDIEDVPDKMEQAVTATDKPKVKTAQSKNKSRVLAARRLDQLRQSTQVEFVPTPAIGTPQGGGYRVPSAGGPIPTVPFMLP